MPLPSDRIVLGLVVDIAVVGVVAVAGVGVAGVADTCMDVTAHMIVDMAVGLAVGSSAAVACIVGTSFI